jgi:trans-aconitate methyltransferase
MEMPLAQRWDPAGYELNARFVSNLGAPVVDLLAPRHGERILDLGCGDGALTEDIAAAGAIVTGVDGSPEFIAAARARGLDAVVMDGQHLTFENAFDAVFSNAALHWMPDPDAVLAGVHRALVRKGRFIAEMGGHGNVAAIVVALNAVLARRGLDAMQYSPWYFPTALEYAAKLEKAGFMVDSLTLQPRTTALPTDMSGWLATFAHSFFAPLAVEDRDVARDEVLALLQPVLRDGAGLWTADYVRLRFAAHRL